MPELLDFTDEQLVEKSLEDSNFFAELIARYERKLSAYLRRFGFGDTDIEDFLQEIFISVYKNLNGFDQKLKFSSWIYRISHNHAISVYRKNKNLEVKVDEKMLNNFADNIDIEGEFDKKLLSENVSKILAKMDLKYREVLVLKYLEDKDYEEMSDILKKPSGTIATLMNRAKKQFKELFKKENLVN